MQSSPSLQPPKTPYRGRFAPSPTGPLHFGSLVAALGSYAEAKAQSGEWRLRMEDLDRPREVPGASRAILTTLEAFGFAWDGPILYQSRRTEAYAAALDHLNAQGLLYACGCSRREIAMASIQGPEGPLYPGTCRAITTRNPGTQAIRLRVEVSPISFRDEVQGLVTQNLMTEVGDFILRRADGLHAYQLAVVVDDAYQGISHVVRGADLTRSTPRQMLLQQYLGLPTPSYAHLPLVMDSEGRKLSKSDAATPVDPRNPVPMLLQAWAFLGQPAFAKPPRNPAEFWTLALASWRLARVPAVATRPPCLSHPK